VGKNATTPITATFPANSPGTVLGQLGNDRHQGVKVNLVRSIEFATTNADQSARVKVDRLYVLFGSIRPAFTSGERSCTPSPPNVELAPLQLAPNSTLRAQIAPGKPRKKRTKQTATSNLSNRTSKPETAEPTQLTWAQRLKRAFEFDVTVCPLCGGTLYKRKSTFHL